MDTIKTALSNAAEGRRKRTRTISLLLAMSTVVSLGVFRQLTLTGITATDDALCGIPEHTHDETCTADCTLAEHVHTLACFPDLEADLETYDDFLASLPDLKGLTGSAAVTVIAQSQLGAAESAKNFTVGDDGIRRGITRYGQWYGNPYGDWSAMFAAFCLHFAGYTSDITPHNAGVESMHLAWKNAGLVRTSGYLPAAGDLLFLDDDASGTADRIAITVTSAGGQLITIEGDVNGAVAASQIAADDARIVGIGALPELAADTDEGATEVVLDSLQFDADGTAITPVEAGNEPSDVQVVAVGDTKADAENGVTISKYIDGTDTENVFDITLTVTTPQKIEEIINEPDMAVVIVMDISNTMTAKFPEGTKTSRYDAAMVAAENFINQFTANNEGASRLGFVAFNTHAHEIFPLSQCNTTAQMTALVNDIKADTQSIMTTRIVYNGDSGATAYGESRDRWTNIEAGLLMAQDMLSANGNKHKYIVLLSDGFPTIYSTGDKTTYTTVDGAPLYLGYNPYSAADESLIGQPGILYDNIQGDFCKYGTSYSDTAAIKAREAATTIKEAGTKIFSIGVDVAGQTIRSYHISSANNAGSHSVVERSESENYYNTHGYEIGTLHSEITKSNPTTAEVTKMAQDFKDWLGGSATNNSIGIGSGYYYDSTNTTELQNAFNTIFTEIKTLNAQDAEALWVTSDTLPISTHPVMKEFEFIGFYQDSNSATATPKLLDSSAPVVGRNAKNELIDNTAKIAEKTDENRNKYDEIRWDLKNSIPKEVTSDGTTRFTYQLTYRVRLENENYEKSTSTVVFNEFQTGDASTIYNTNANASLTYRILKSTTTNGQTTVTIVDPKPLVYPIPAVKGWLGELSFKKQDNYGRMVAGAVFHLAHDASCSTCRGDGKSAVFLDDTEARYTAVSNADGSVSFKNLPSGHTYLMTETEVPAGYASGNLTWKVNIAYDTVTVTPLDSSVWNGIVLNYTSYELPQTGGRGTAGYVLVGFTLLALPFTSVIRRRKGGRSASK